jgi:hypothetical protein
VRGRTCGVHPNARPTYAVDLGRSVCPSCLTCEPRDYGDGRRHITVDLVVSQWRSSHEAAERLGIEAHRITSVDHEAGTVTYLGEAHE